MKEEAILDMGNFLILKLYVMHMIEFYNAASLGFSEHCYWDAAFILWLLLINC